MCASRRIVGWRSSSVDFLGLSQLKSRCEECITRAALQRPFCLCCDWTRNLGAAVPLLGASLGESETARFCTLFGKPCRNRPKREAAGSPHKGAAPSRVALGSHERTILVDDSRGTSGKLPPMGGASVIFPLETNIVIKLRSAVRNWYEGKYLPYENDPRSTLVFIGGDHKRHWTARVVRVLVEFWHWSSLSAWLRSS